MFAPTGLSGVVAIAAGGAHSLALTVGNAPPAITAQTVTRQAGTAAALASIATVSDAQDATAALTISVTPASGSGVTVTNPVVDNSVNVTATVEASCAAPTSTFTLRVTDSGGLFTEATLNVTVDANQPPTLSYPSNPGTVYGTGITVDPLTGPSDDLGVTSVVVQRITPTNPGGITVASNGVVTVANNVPAGTYTVTIRANAACSNKDASFRLCAEPEHDCPHSDELFRWCSSGLGWSICRVSGNSGFQWRAPRQDLGDRSGDLGFVTKFVVPLAKS